MLPEAATFPNSFTLCSRKTKSVMNYVWQAAITAAATACSVAMVHGHTRNLHAVAQGAASTSLATQTVMNQGIEDDDDNDDEDDEDSEDDDNDRNRARKRQRKK